MTMQRHTWKDMRSEAVRNLGVHIGAIGVIAGLIFAAGGLESDKSERERLDEEMFALASTDAPGPTCDHGNLIVEFEEFPLMPATTVR
ncbi:hypothetical protein ACUSIJ_04880 [Pseudochelatococcus sp. B33]